MNCNQNPFAAPFHYQPFQDISVVICEVTSANKLRNFNSFSHSWAEKTLYLLCIITRWQHQHVSTDLGLARLKTEMIL